MKKETYKTYKTGLRATPLPPCVTKKHQRDPKESPGEPRAPQGEHENAKETPEDPKGCQKSAGDVPKISKKGSKMR